MKKIFFILFFLISSSFLFAQNIDDFFVFLPESYLSQLSSDQRMELLSKLRSKKDCAVTNNYGGRSKLLAFDPVNNYIKVQISEQGFFEAKKWILEDATPLFAMSFWVCSPACDGGISFFRNSYTSVMPNKNQFPNVEIDDFFNKEGLAAKEMSENELKNKFDLFFIRFEFQPEGNDILVINDNKSYMNKEDYEKWKPYLKGNCLPLIWKNGHFEKGKAYFRE